MANTYLQKTFSSVPTMTTFTVSFWVKRGKLGTSQCILESRQSGSTLSSIKFSASDRIAIYGEGSGTTKCDIMSSVRFRDTSGWYNVCIAVNTTLASANDRVRLYVNGVEDTDVTRNTAQVQNWEWYFSLNYPVNIGRDDNNSGSEFFDGSMSHFHYCTGTQYQASAFGSQDATTGEWKINTSPSVSYGTNGYFILKDGNSVTDQSGLSNNFTVAGGNFTKTEDNPSNVFNTLNPLDKTYGSTGTFSNGNTTQNQTGQSGHHPFYTSTLGFSSGKYYWEMKCVSGHSDNWYATGITSTICTANNNWLGQNANSYSIYGYSYGGGIGSTYTGGTRTNQGLSFTAGDIIGCAVDCDNLAIYWSKNGVWMSNASSVQGVPTSGSSKTGSCFTITAPSSTDTGVYFPSVCYYDYQNAVQQMNFGNGYFGTSAVSSAGTNASGIGIFEYDVPTGYTALSTKGLNE
jgi:hypothetical protein